uniref:Uncharacterized protein n=1 Tax=viral metagenome TaxID=1070528 RepID=A0A6C0CRH0_9ZZZZ
MTSLFNNLKLTGGGNRNAGLVHNIHFSLHRMARGKSQQHSMTGLHNPILIGAGLPSCPNIELDLWCEYPAVTDVDASNNQISTVTKSDLEAYIANIILFVKSFNTKNIIIRFTSPNIRLDWTIDNTDRMYQALTGTGGTYANSLSGIDSDRTIPFYRLDDKNDKSTIGYLIDQIKTLPGGSSKKIYMLPYVSFDSGYFSDLFVTSLTPTSPISGYSHSTSDNTNAVNSFWSAVKFYEYYNSKVNSLLSYSLDGIIIETENSQLDKSVIAALPSAQNEARMAYHLFSTTISTSLQNVGVNNYNGAQHTDIKFGLTGSPTISKTINQINTLKIAGYTIKITTLWPQYYNIGAEASYSTLNKKNVAQEINKKYNWVQNDNDTSAEVMGMLSIETPYIRKRITLSSGNPAIDYTNARTPFFGQSGWNWDNICYVVNKAIINKKLKDNTPLRGAIFSGAILSTNLGNNETTQAETSLTKLPANAFQLSTNYCY